MATMNPSDDVTPAAFDETSEPLGTRTGTRTGSDPLGAVRGALRDPAATLERVVQGAHQAIDRVAATTIPAVEQWSQKASLASESLNDRADRLGEVQEQWLDDARHTVREHPLASVLGALALGMLVARLTR